MDSRVTQFQKEEDDLLYSILDTRFFNVWRSKAEGTRSLKYLSNVELYITSECNLKCEYCYLMKYGDKLYPKEHRTVTKIIKNMSIFLDWMIAQGFSINTLELFSGEIWHTDFGMDVLTLILEKIKVGLHASIVMIPTNCSFALKEETLNRMQAMIDSYKQNGVVLCISCSVEGALLEDISRPMREQGILRDSAFYERVFSFAGTNNFYFHPMVAASNIDKWIENLKWFEAMCNKHKVPFPRGVMMLEVRNSDWTDEALAHLIKYYDYQLETLFNKCDGSSEKFSRTLLGGNDVDAENMLSGYVNFTLPFARPQPACSIAELLSVRMGDLTIVPCHRLAYPQFNYGRFRVENDVITGIEALNTQMACKVLLSNQLNSNHGCDACKYNTFCMRGCMGEQYEETKEPFMPDPNVCKMMHAKYDFLMEVYNSYGVIDFIENLPPTDPLYFFANEILCAIKSVKSADSVQRGGGQC